MMRSLVVRVEGWESFPWLRAGFSRRSGGVSTAYGGKSLNLGWKDDEEDANTSQNRRRFLDEVHGDFGRHDAPFLVTTRQVHGNQIHMAGRGTGLLETEYGRSVLEGDGLLTDDTGVMLGVQVADCVPILVADVKRRVVGAFHAGWRGTMARIVEHGITRMRKNYGSQPGDLVGAIGPSIGPCCYSVGEEVGLGFVAEFEYGEKLIERRESDMYLDLWEANRRQMVEAGVAEGAVTLLGECSACTRDEDGARRYFSHRGEMGGAGRMMGVIGMVADAEGTRA